MAEEIGFERRLDGRRWRFAPDPTAPGSWIASSPADPIEDREAERYSFRCGGVRPPSMERVLVRFVELRAMRVESEPPPPEDVSWLYENERPGERKWGTP